MILLVQCINLFGKKKQQNAIFESIDDESDNEIETFNNYSLFNYGTLKKIFYFISLDTL